MAKEKGKTLGAWAFLIGVIVAVVLGLFVSPAASYYMYLVILLVIIGLVIGLLNVSGKETQAFLLAGVALVVVSNFGKESFNSVSYLVNVLNALLILFVPATIVEALKSVFAIAKD
jgi:hypothetical protein